MLYEYAVEPKAIGASWENFRYLIEKFGFDRGRLISQFPGKWIQEVIEVAKQSGMRDVRYKSLIEKLQRAKREALIRSARKYDSETGDWLDNAIQQHFLEPFHGIIASENRGAKDFIIVTEDIIEETPLMVAPIDWEVEQVGEVLAKAMSPLLKSAKKILFVDPYFDIRELRYKETLEASLSIVASSRSSGVQCEIHFRDHETRPSTEYVINRAHGWFLDVIPEGVTVRLFNRKQKMTGDSFHARFLLTDRGGMIVEAGFSSEGSHQKVLLKLLGFEYCQEKMAVFERDSTVYDLVESIFEISAGGKVRRI